jgi:hypothetical protein
MRDCSRRREVGDVPAQGIQPVATENSEMKRNPDMRGRIVFPPRPATKEDIFDSPCPAWIIACSLVGKFDRWQVNTYRKLHGLIGDDWLYREIIDVTRVIFDESRNIIVPPAFLAAQFKLAAEGKEVYR